MKYIITIFFLFGCSTVHNSGGNSRRNTTNVDSSSVQKEYNRATTIQETAGKEAYTRQDIASISGHKSAVDTSVFRQEVVAGALHLITVITPRVKDGAITGYDIDSRAKKDSEMVVAPVNKIITTNETGMEIQQTNINEATLDTSSWWNKHIKRVPVGIQLAAGAGLIVLLIIGGFKIFR